jgi:indolepyruvate ferredoxin oxidoreductase alpha subunit
MDGAGFSIGAQRVLLGDEAVALAAVHAGISAAYAYPGTPSTEITEFLVAHYQRHGAPFATWSANEKTAYEEALGVSMVGRRALVSMKHVGLNVAADPFMNSALVAIKGGLVVAVADDPGMHSSQNEQDTRYFADFAHTILLEPSSQQEAWDMTLEAFDLSERFSLPVVLRLVTRLAHSRAVVTLGERRAENALEKTADPRAWTLLPANARVQWRRLLAQRPEVLAWTEESRHNRLRLADRRLGVITTGIARNYYEENARDLDFGPSSLHIGAYPIPVGLVRQLASHVERILVIEEGYPYVERLLRGLLPPVLPVAGKQDGWLPLEGELNPDLVRKALGLPALAAQAATALHLPGRPPQLCAGCPHADTLAALKAALADFDRKLVTSDIGCYTLGALPPYNAVESCVCMGASVSMAAGAAHAGMHPVAAVIGDSTFLHSGVTPLMDAIATDAPMTLVIVDNQTVAMTGGQPTVLPSSQLQGVVLGLGARPEHVHVVRAHVRSIPEMTEVLRRELAHRGLSVVIAVRECIETARKRARDRKSEGGQA